MRHSRQIKEEAAARMRVGDVPLFDLAREYGVSTNTLRTWLRECDARARAQASAKRVASALTKERSGAISQRQRVLIHALEQSPATVIVTDAEGKIVYANPKFVETTGYGIEEVIGCNPRILKSGETSAGEYRKLWKSITGGKEWRGVFHNRRKDGRLYWERASISPVLDADGKITNFMAVKEDITEFMEADALRRRALAHYQAVFAALPNGVLLVDEEGRLLMANPAAEALLGTPLPTGAAVEAFNIRWMDAHGSALTGRDHPIARVFQLADTATASPETGSVRLGVVPPTGGVRWLDCAARLILLPEPGMSAVAMLSITPAAA